ncbi:MAG TPA: primosomal protein [Pseudonocardia sp.]|jgi:hypothetical protein|nr:primosomal protein [Pseudonocardia sp.]
MDIVSIQLSLTAGDLITLWAPPWRADGEDWEAFLGDEEHVHAFPDAARLAAYVRTVTEHDLADHPAWPQVLQLSATELVPTEDQCYDLVGLPEIAAEKADSWTVSELANIIAMVRSLADACGLDEVREVLDSTEAFDSLERGTWAFTGREGAKLWDELGATVAARWDTVIDSLDHLVRTPDVDEAALEAARVELAGSSGRPGEVTPAADTDSVPAAATNTPTGTDAAAVGGVSSPAPDTAPADLSATEPWDELGIDPIQINTDDGTYYTLRCYLDDKPVFFGLGGRIRAFDSATALAGHLGSDAATDGHDLTRASTWPEVLERSTRGELPVAVEPGNSYHLAGLAEDLRAGPLEVDPNQLDLAVELLKDVDEWAGDDTATDALAPSATLGWLTSFVLAPDPTRLVPSPPFDAEAQRWTDLVTNLGKRLNAP